MCSDLYCLGVLSACSPVSAGADIIWGHNWDGDPGWFMNKPGSWVELGDQRPAHDSLCRTESQQGRLALKQSPKWLHRKLPEFSDLLLRGKQCYFHSLLLLTAAAAAAKFLQSCLTLCDPTDGSPTGSPVPGIPQARTLEWVAISSSNAWKWKVKVKLLSRNSQRSTELQEKES